MSENRKDPKKKKEGEMGDKEDDHNWVILKILPFHAASAFVGNMYKKKDECNDASNAVDFCAASQEDGFAFVADTTGHRYETPIQLKKKQELGELWKEFHNEIFRPLMDRLKQPNKKMTWGECQNEIRVNLRKVSEKMMNLGKSSTFSAVLTVLVGRTGFLNREKQQPMAIVIQVGDSLIFQYSNDSVPQNGQNQQQEDNDKSYWKLLLRQNAALSASIAGNLRGMDIELYPYKSGDVFLLTTDGFHDHFQLKHDEQSNMENKIKFLDSLDALIRMSVMNHYSNSCGRSHGGGSSSSCGGLSVNNNSPNGRESGSTGNSPRESSEKSGGEGDRESGEKGLIVKGGSCGSEKSDENRRVSDNEISQSSVNGSDRDENEMERSSTEKEKSTATITTPPRTPTPPTTPTKAKNDDPILEREIVVEVDEEICHSPSAPTKSPPSPNTNTITITKTTYKTDNNSDNDNTNNTNNTTTDLSPSNSDPTSSSAFAHSDGIVITTPSMTNSDPTSPNNSNNNNQNDDNNITNVNIMENTQNVYLEDIYMDIMHSARKISREKLNENKIRESELDDVGCVIAISHGSTPSNLEQSILKGNEKPSYFSKRNLQSLLVFPKHHKFSQTKKHEKPESE